MIRTVRLIGAAGVVTFGAEGFVLHALRCGAPSLTGGARTVELEGYILPEGEDEAAEDASLAARSRRVRRIAADADGFTLEIDGRRLRLWCEEAPRFAEEPPFTTGDAARFTLRAVSGAREEAFFSAAEITAGGAAVRGALAFPLPITTETTFGCAAAAGGLTVENPGDMPCGFVAEARAAGGEITSLTLRCGGASICVRHALADGAVLTIDTRPGRRGVTAGGVSVLGEVDWQSEFFSLAPGENALTWESEGAGNVRLRVRLTLLVL